MCALQTTFGLKAGQSLPRFGLFGFGGAGCNLIADSLFPTIAVGTDPSELERCKKAKWVVLTASELTGYADSDPSVLSLNMLPSNIKDSFSDVDIPILAAGLGGFAGSKGMKLFASVSKMMNKMSISIVSLPFSVESAVRRETATNVLNDLRRRSDLVISFENDKLTTLVPKMPIEKAFKLMNAIMERPVMDISRVMAESDVSMMRQISQRSGLFKLGVGLGRGAMRDVAAMKEALLSPWFEVIRDDVASAFLIISSYPIDQGEVHGIVRDIQSEFPNARLMYGDYEDPLLGDKLRVTLLIGKPLLGGE